MSRARAKSDSRAARRSVAAVVLLLVCVLGADLLAQSPTAVSIPKPTLPALTSSDHRDVVVLLESGPLVMRLKVALGGSSLVEARKAYVAALIDKLDADKDGKLTRKEADRSPILRTKQRPGAAEFLQSLRGATTLTPRDVTQAIDRIGGEAVAYREDLTSSQNDIEVFKLFDTDKDNVLGPSELAAAAELIMSKDDDGDQCVSFQEFFPPPPPPDPMQVALIQANPPPPPLATIANLIRDTRDPLLPRRLLKKYDRNRDESLTAAELAWTSERLKALDATGNGLLDAGELAAIGSAPPDLDLAVDLKAAGSEGGALNVLAAIGKRLDDQTRPDYVKLAFSNAVVTFSQRNIDTVAASIENALQQFNIMDADANGYLSREETAERIRFVRGLFDLMDADSDEKVFADEMKEYVRARAEPVAATCRVNLYDTGNGFFMALDGNADGRISEREKRQSQKSLGQLERDGQPGVGQKEPVRHFHIEFARGSYNLFGASEQLIAQTPAFQRRLPSGPIWFQRMDRNNDGDLTWNEFLGPREIYHELDGDHDDLLDPNEAVKAN